MCALWPDHSSCICGQHGDCMKDWHQEGYQDALDGIHILGGGGGVENWNTREGGGV